MKLTILTILALSQALPVHAADLPAGIPDPRLLLLLGISLLTGGLLLFLLLVLGSAFRDRNQARKRAATKPRRRQAREPSQQSPATAGKPAPVRVTG